MKTQRWKEVVGASGFAERANYALKLFEARGGPIPSQPWLAAKATSFLDDDVITQPVVGRWLGGKSVPDTPPRAWAFARALMVDPGWLVFGEECSASPPQPGAPVMRVAEHPPTEIARLGGTEVPERRPQKRKRSGS